MPVTAKFTTVYPNPAFDIVSIDFYLDKTSTVSIEVFSSTGLQVCSGSVRDVTPGFNYTNLDVAHYGQGIYIIKLLQDGAMVDTRMLTVIK